MRRGVVIGSAAGVAVLVVAAAAAWWVWGRPPGPGDAAKAYLDALAAGDGDSAIALLTGDPENRESLLGAFTGAAGFIEQPEVVSTETESDTSATTEAVFTLDGEERSATFTLHRDETGWRIAEDGLGVLTASTSLGDTVAVGAALVGAGDPLPLLPAAYPVTPAPVGILGGGGTALVLPSGSASIEIDASIEPDALGAAQEQFDAHLTTCTQPATTVPTGCGVRIPWAADFTSLSGLAFRIETAPALDIADDGSLAATGGALVVTASGTPRPGGTERVTYRVDGWSLYGDVEFTGNEMVLVLR